MLVLMVGYTSNFNDSYDFSQLKKGQDDVKFGPYEWTVLDIKKGKALLMTNEIVETIKYQEESHSIDWIGSHLRWYLNWKFINQQFGEQEQNRMVDIFNKTPDNPWTGASGGGDSKDKLFTLSVEEALLYFGDSGVLSDLNSDQTYVIDDQYNENRMGTYKNENMGWWLRSPGKTAKFTTVVTKDGSIREASVNETYGLRLFTWVKMR